MCLDVCTADQKYLVCLPCCSFALVPPKTEHLNLACRCINLAHFCVDEAALNYARELCKRLVCRQLADGRIITPCSHPTGAQCCLPVAPA